MGCVLILTRAKELNGTKVQTHILRFIFFITEIILTDCKSLISFTNLAVSMIPSRSPFLSQLPSAKEAHLSTRVRKSYPSNANQKHSVNHHLGDKLVYDVDMWTGSRWILCIDIYTWHTSL